MAFKRRGRSNGNSDFARITTLFAKDEGDLPKFLRSKWTVALKTDDEYFEALADKVKEAEDKGVLFIDVSEPKDNDGNLVLSVAAFEPREGGKRGGKKRRDDDDDEKPRSRRREAEEEEDADEKPRKRGGKGRR
jgi:hypothetical protein